MASKLPDSVRALTKSRPFIQTASVSPWPLRDSTGITWAEHRRLRDEAAKQDKAA